MPGASQQTRIALEIIVESAVLYSVAALIYIPMDAAAIDLNSAAWTYFVYAQLFYAFMAVSISHPILCLYLRIHLLCTQLDRISRQH
jgi:hypothetical protein